MLRSMGDPRQALGGSMWLGAEEAEAAAASLQGKSRKGRGDLERLLSEIVVLKVCLSSCQAPAWQTAEGTGVLICSCAMEPVPVALARYAWGGMLQLLLLMNVGLLGLQESLVDLAPPYTLAVLLPER